VISVSDERFDALRELCQKYDIEILYVFGSRSVEVSEWLNNPRQILAASASDIDIGIKPASSTLLSVHQKVLLAQALEDLFNVVRVDLVVLPEADPFLAANIIRGERVYQRDAVLADEYDLYILRRAGDLAPMERERMALILGENQ
jgi:uncharacterized protein